MNKLVAMTIGYLGPECAGFGYQATCLFVKSQKLKNVTLKPYGTHDQICEAVVKGDVNLGLVAIENTVAGFVDESLESLAKWHTLESIRAIHEIALDVDIKAYVSKGFKPEGLKKVFSHSVGLTQCKKYIESLKAINPELVIEACLSTGDAADKASQNECSIALTGSAAALKYKLHLLGGEDIIRADYKSSTRFFVISKTSTEIDDNTNLSLFKTMICCEMTLTETGALAKTLQIFANEKINMRVVHEIRTPNRSWEYRFLIEFEGHKYEPRFLRAFENFKKSGVSMSPPVIYGSYTKAV